MASGNFPNVTYVPMWMGTLYVILVENTARQRHRSLCAPAVCWQAIGFSIIKMTFDISVLSGHPIWCTTTGCDGGEQGTPGFLVCWPAIHPIFLLE